MDFPTDATWIWTGVLLLLICLLYYRYIFASVNQWEEAGIPNVPLSISGLLKMFFSKQGAHEQELEKYMKYGRIYGSYEGTRPVLCVGDLDLLRNILIKDFSIFPGRRKLDFGDNISNKMLSVVHGDTWKRIRNIIVPAFATGKIKRMTDIIYSSSKTLAQNFANKNGKPVDMKNLFDTFTMDVIASVAFGTKINSHEDPNNRFSREAKKAFGTFAHWRFFLLVLLPKLAKFLNISAFDKQASLFFQEAVLQIIKDRRESGRIRNDFLQMLLEAEKESQQQNTPEMETEKETETEIEKSTDDINAEQLGHEVNTTEHLKTSSNTKFLSHDEMIAQCVMFFLGGFDTASSTLTFATYLLAINPEIQNKLRDDVDTVLREHDGKLTYTAMQEMKYLDNVISETLRMYPPGIRLERVAGEDYKLGDTGIVLKKDTVVTVPVYAIHHDPEHYPEPDKFKPERFTTEEKAKRHPYSYLTFGAGPRNCVAMRFALMEVKFCLAYLISQFIIRRCPETKVPLDIVGPIFILQPKNLFLSFEKRENRVFDGLQINEDAST